MTQEVKLRRVQCTYRAENARFLLECNFSKQYDHYYRKRLEKSRALLEINCSSKWGAETPIYSLAELAEFSLGLDDSDFGSSPSSLSGDIDPKNDTKSADNSPNEQHAEFVTGFSHVDRHLPSQDELGKSLFERPSWGSANKNVAAIRRPTNSCSAECIVIGTIFKRMKMQPDVIEELSKGDFHVKCERYLGHYTSQSDTLVLEDSEESISLVGNINPKNFVTGIVVGLKGISINDGSEFCVRDICFAEPNKRIIYEEWPSQQHDIGIDSPLHCSDARSVFLLVVSGLGFHHDMSKKSALTRALQNMIDFVWGGGNYSNDERSSRVARILVVGDSLSGDRLGQIDNKLDDQDIAAKMKYSRQVKPYAESIKAVRHMDDFFAQLSKTINVDVMPGPSDPSSHLFPQQPFHPCMFPKSCAFATFNCTTNPYHAVFNENVEILATSGQNVDIISKFSGLQDPIEIMKCHLMWGNSAPSAPDNLYSVPYEEDDPHVIDFIPEIYLVGGQDSHKRDFYYYTTYQSTDNSKNYLTSESSRVDSSFVNITPESAHDRASTSAPMNSSTPIASSSYNQSRRGGSPLPPYLQSEVAGNQEECIKQRTTNCDFNLSQSKKSRTLLLTVPKFCDTYNCVLIDLKNLDSQLLSFK